MLNIPFPYSHCFMFNDIHSNLNSLLQVPSTTFSVCVVVDETERTKTIVDAPMLDRINFYRTDLLEEVKQPPKCALGNVIGYKGR